MKGLRIWGPHPSDKGNPMGKSIKILHIDNRFEGFYMIIREGITIRSAVDLKETLKLLKMEEFDLILSEPHNMAILKTADQEGSQDLEFS
jgi:hypothetical protein